MHFHLIPDEPGHMPGYCPEHAPLDMPLSECWGEGAGCECIVCEEGPYVPCPGCGTRNFDKDAPMDWKCPEYPGCAEGAW